MATDHGWPLRVPAVGRRLLSAGCRRWRPPDRYGRRGLDQGPPAQPWLGLPAARSTSRRAAGARPDHPDTITAHQLHRERSPSAVGVSDTVRGHLATASMPSSTQVLPTRQAAVRVRRRGPGRRSRARESWARTDIKPGAGACVSSSTAGESPWRPPLRLPEHIHTPDAVNRAPLRYASLRRNH